MQLIDLSHPLEDGQPGFPGDPQLRVEACQTTASTGCNLTQVTLSTHQGTHLDAPYHFFDAGATIDQLPLGRFFGPATLVDLAPGAKLAPQTAITPEMLAPHAAQFQCGAKVLYRTGWDCRWGQADYFHDYPALTVDAARWIAAQRIELLGMDTPSPSDGKETHEILLGPGVEIVLVENLTRLETLPERFTFSGFPLNIRGRDGAPIRAVALVSFPNP